ncbi:hypothetical protein ACTMSW_26550 [Micromonospora sp. BQ11]|uniref:hypothetical protein n=1 Tax=Micromonospora sp. BQ11 TaxID=3452212 RepID=UPI003F8B5BF3
MGISFKFGCGSGASAIRRYAPSWRTPGALRDPEGTLWSFGDYPGETARARGAVRSRRRHTGG